MRLKKYLLILSLLLAIPAHSAEKLTVLLDWFPNPDHAPIIVAEQRGYFKAAGLEVTLIGPSDPTDPPKLIAAGQADIAIDYQPQFLMQVDQGLPLIQIGTLIDKPLNCLVTIASSQIKSLADLKGKTIGSSNSGMNKAMLQTMLTKHHINLNQVQTINIHYDLTQALLSGKVDAVTGMMRNFEVTQMELAGHPARAFYPEENGMPNYSELIFIVKATHENDPRFSAFLHAVKRGTEYLKQHPEETWTAFALHYPESNDELNHRAWLATLPYFANDPAKVSATELLRFASFLQQNNLIKNIQPIQTYTVQLEPNTETKKG
jgi:putative hydroxymethylpyrimidine transport system substrate-binding protein